MHAGVEPGADEERLSGLSGLGGLSGLNGLSGLKGLTRFPPRPECGHGAQVPSARPGRQWRVSVRPSLRLFAAVGTGHGAAVLAVLLAPVSLPLRLPLLLLCAASLAASLRQVVFLTAPDAVVGLAVDDQAGAVVQRRDGRSQHGRVLPSSFVAAPLTIVRLRLVGEWLPRSVVLVGGNCDPDAWRRLRVALAWRIGPRLETNAGRAH